MKMLFKYSKDFSATPEARYFYISWLVIYNQQLKHKLINPEPTDQCLVQCLTSVFVACEPDQCTKRQHVRSFAKYLYVICSKAKPSQMPAMPKFLLKCHMSKLPQ